MVRPQVCTVQLGAQGVHVGEPASAATAPSPFEVAGVLSAPVAAALQWPVLLYSVGVLVLGGIAYTALAAWYLAFATPWVELGGAGVLHVLPQSPLVRAYHAYYLGPLPPN